MPIPGDAEHWVGRGADQIKAERHDNSSDDDPPHGPKRAHPAERQKARAEQAGKGGCLAQGARDGAPEGRPPVGTVEGTGLGGCLREQGGSAKSVDACEVGSDPGGVSAHRRRIGKEEERTSRQGRVQEIHSDPAKDLLGHHDAKERSQGHHPQRDRRWQRQGEKRAGDEEALVYFVASHDCEDRFGDPPYDHHRGVDRNPVEGAEENAMKVAFEIERETQGLPEGGLPGVQGGGPLGDGEHALVSRVPAGHQHAGQEGHDHGHHQALHVRAVTDMGCGPGDLARSEQEAGLEIEKRPELFVFAALLKKGSEIVEFVAQELHPGVSPLSR